jgi:TQXA domain-containing protein
MGPPGGSEGGSATYARGYDVVGGGIVYILQNGYPTKTTVSGDSFSDLAKPAECARAATQLAIWMYTGDMTLSGDYVKDGVTKNAITVCNGSARSQRCVAAAATLCQAAIAHDNDYYRAYVARWSSPDGSTQSMYYGIPIAYTNTVNATVDSANTDMTGGNAGYTFSGTQYVAYRDSACTQAIETATTGVDGAATFKKLSTGTVYVKQTAAGSGYVTDTSVKTVSLQLGTSASVSFTDTPQYAIVDPVVVKQDADTGEQSPLGSATLAGAVYKMTYWKQGSTTASATWTFTTDESGKAALSTLSGSDAYKMDGKTVFPIGRYEIVETKAPAGYSIDTTTSSFSVEADKTKGALLTKYGSVYAKDSVVRSNVTLTKIDSDTGETLAGIPFKVTSKTTGESHIVVTDAQGYLNTAATARTSNVNANDASVASDGTVDETKLSSSYPVWFSGTTTSTVAASTGGALPYDTYEFTELSVRNNWKHKLVSFTATVSSSKIVNLGKIGDDQIKITTSAVDKTDGDKNVTYNNPVIIDTVNYTGVRVGEAYELVATLMVVNDDGTSFEVVHEDGSELKVRKAFIPTTQDGSVDVEIAFEGDDYAGLNVVVFEKLFYHDVEVANHEDITDAEQTVLVGNPAALRTEAAFSNGTKSASPQSGLTIVDAVTYSHLDPGTYVIRATLHDHETGDSLYDSNGDEIIVEKELVIDAEDATGTIDMEIPFDAQDREAGVVVVFERAYKKSGDNLALAAFHEDLEDTYQTVTIEEKPITIAEILPPTGQLPIAAGMIAIGAAAGGVGVMKIKRNKPKRPDIY